MLDFFLFKYKYEKSVGLNLNRCLFQFVNESYFSCWWDLSYVYGCFLSILFFITFRFVFWDWNKCFNFLVTRNSPSNWFFFWVIVSFKMFQLYFCFYPLSSKIVYFIIHFQLDQCNCYCFINYFNVLVYSSDRPAVLVVFLSHILWSILLLWLQLSIIIIWLFFFFSFQYIWNWIIIHTGGYSILCFIILSFSVDLLYNWRILFHNIFTV